MTRAPQISSYLLPGGVTDPTPALAQAREAEALGLGAVWLGERIDTKDFPSILGAVSQVTEHILLGVGITPMNLRHPMVLAAAGQTLQALSKGRFRMGFGKSASWRWEGYGYPEPTVESMRDVATILRRLWAGETIHYNGPAGTFPNIRMAQRTNVNPPPLYLAAIGPRTLEMAGAAFDGVILHPFLTPDAVGRSARIVREAAQKTGRDPERIRIVATVVTAPDLSDAETRLAIHARGAGYFEVKGLGDMIVKANGWNAADLAAYRDDPRLVALGGKPADKFMTRDALIALTEVMPEHWIPSASASGSSAHCAAVFRDYLAAGADEILVHGSTADQLSGLIAAFSS